MTAHFPRLLQEFQYTSGGVYRVVCREWTTIHFSPKYVISSKMYVVLIIYERAPFGLWRFKYVECVEHVDILIIFNRRPIAKTVNAFWT